MKGCLANHAALDYDWGQFAGKILGFILKETFCREASLKLNQSFVRMFNVNFAMQDNYFFTFKKFKGYHRKLSLISPPPGKLNPWSKQNFLCLYWTSGSKILTWRKAAKKGNFKN